MLISIQLGGNCQHLWRHCKAVYFASTSAGLQGDNARKKTLIDEAVTLGEKAVAADESNAEAHKWYAIAVGSRGEFVGVKEKILDGFEFKRHVSRAAELAPKDHTVQHLLGRFCFEVAELSWWERKMAATLFAEPPTATLEEAEEHFLAAERLKPEGWKENRHFLAKTLIKMQNIEEGVRWLEKADSLPVRNPDVSGFVLGLELFIGVTSKHSPSVFRTGKLKTISMHFYHNMNHTGVSAIRAVETQFYHQDGCYTFELLG